jgi:hypothetical protein
MTDHQFDDELYEVQRERKRALSGPGFSWLYASCASVSFNARLRSAVIEPSP